MPDLNTTVPIAHDAPLTEIRCVENGVRFRVYRGDTQEHIDWKLYEHRKNQKHSHAPELIEVGNQDSPPDLQPTG